eukprot:TRINITY_DN113229_c0_g1_i1.p1 TRINITY_DN113229_c0_g1~~TRINITY_DN113229_c0_g1_i1.p1  ORF type:complete len:328 (+),score=27.08 TRINITY_DN113229_c0_g1_i1:30-1013(+)
MPTSPWLLPVCSNSTPEDHVQIFIFPYAGGNPTDFMVPTFSSFRADVWVVHLPGRGQRIAESNIDSCEELSSAVCEALLPFLQTGSKFSFFGYSMGALLAFEVARKLQQQQQPPPSVLFVAADAPPKIQTSFVDPYLPDDKFVRAIKDLNFTSADVLENEDLLKLAVPALRSDMKVEYDYKYSEEPHLQCPIVAFCGTDDSWVSPEQMQQWRECSSSSSFEVVPLLGAGHMFLSDSTSMATIRASMANWNHKVNLMKTFPMGEQEAVEVARVEQQCNAKRVGGVWVKWDKSKNQPAERGTVEDDSLGAYYSDIKDVLAARGFTIDQL